MCKELSNIKYVLFDSSIIFAGSENMDLFFTFSLGYYRNCYSIVINDRFIIGFVIDTKNTQTL